MVLLLYIAIKTTLFNVAIGKTLARTRLPHCRTTGWPTTTCVDSLSMTTNAMKSSDIK